MRPFVNLFLLAGCLLGSLSPAAAVAETPRKIDVKRLSKNIDDVVVPLPNEIFGALNKLDSVNWKEFVRTNKGTNFTERPRIALLLGRRHRRRFHRRAGGGRAERERDWAAGR